MPKIILDVAKLIGLKSGLPMPKIGFKGDKPAPTQPGENGDSDDDVSGVF